MGWQHFFAGREQELAILQTAWEAVKGGTPQLIALIGDTGMGKTRLIQRFYDYLAQDSGANTGYWPARIDANDPPEAQGAGRRASLNPPMAGQINPQRMHYLWLAMQARPGQNAMIDAFQPLQTHSLSHAASQLTSQQMNDLFIVLGKSGMEAALDLVAEILPPYKIVCLLAKVIQIGADLSHMAYKTLTERNRQLEGVIRSSPSSLELTAQRNLSDDFLNALAVFHGANHPLPVVLVLDDAQNANPMTWEFIEKVLCHAKVHGWKLLLIVSIHEFAVTSAPPSSRFRRVPPPSRWNELLDDNLKPVTWIKIPIGPLESGMESIVEQAFPTMPESSRRVFTETARGEPLFLRQLLILARAHADAWLEPDGSLTPDGRDKIESTATLNEVAQALFDGLEPQLRSLLGWGSRVGEQFPHLLTRMLAADTRCLPAFPSVVHDQNIVTIGKLAGLLDYIPDYDGSQFSQRSFHRIAHQFLLEEGPRYVERVEDCLRYALRLVIADGTLTALALPIRSDILQLANRELKPPGPIDVKDPAWRPWAQASADLIDCYNRLFLWDHVERVLEEICPPSQAWPLEVLTASRQLAICGELIRVQKFPVADGWLTSLLAEPLTSFELIQTRILLGNILAANAEWIPAICSYNMGIDSARAGIEEEGDNRQLLRALAMCLGYIADIQLEISENPEHYFLQARDISEEVIQKFGRDREALRDLAVCWQRLGENYEIRELFEQAASAYTRAHELMTEIVETFGSDYQSLRDLWCSFINLGDVAANQNHWDATQEPYFAAFNVMRKVDATYGRSAEVLSDLWESHMRLGHFAFAHKNRPEAFRFFKIALEIADHMGGKYGWQLETRRRQASIHEAIAKVHLSRAEFPEARSALFAAIEVLNGMLTVWGRQLSILRFLFVLQMKLGEILESPENARECFLTARAVAQEILESKEVLEGPANGEGEQQPPRYLDDVRNLAESHIKLMKVYDFLTNLPEAHQHWLQASNLCAEMEAQFPDSNQVRALSERLRSMEPGPATK